MRVRYVFSCLLLVSAFVAGCQPPEARFAGSDRLKTLVRDARRPIQNAIDESFGTPQQLVAWQRLPVDFGEFKGKVASVAESDVVDRFQAELEIPAADVEQKAGEFLQKTSVLWTSGEYADLVLHVANFDANTGTLTLLERMNPPPAAGDEFVVIGYNLSHGRKLYMHHCVHCHGTAGDGAGPTAPYLNPRPRDYRKGLFKFTSTTRQEKPTPDDLKRTIKQGLPGTYMPSFLLLEDAEIDALVEYVRFLSIRGEMEDKLITELAADYSTEAYNQRLDQLEQEYEGKLEAYEQASQTGGEPEEPLSPADELEQKLQEFLTTEFPDLVELWSNDISEAWVRAEDESSIIIPKSSRPVATTESIAHGRQLFMGDKAKCASCHGATAIGNGAQSEDFQKIPGTQETFKERGLHDEWGYKVKPRDLTAGIYRGGRRPLDIYRRVHSGVKGTPMAGFATALTEEEMWDIVNFVLSIPYEGPAAGTEIVSARPAESGKVASLPESGSK